MHETDPNIKHPANLPGDSTMNGRKYSESVKKKTPAAIAMMKKTVLWYMSLASRDFCLIDSIGFALAILDLIFYKKPPAYSLETFRRL